MKKIFFSTFFLLFTLLIISCDISSLGLKSLSKEDFNEFNSPNFILILVDDQGWNGTSVQMSQQHKNSKSDFHQTPNLEKLAKNGMRFSQAYATSPVCAPSRYSLQFGKTAARLNMIRVQMNTDHINHNTSITIPKVLKKINPNYTAAHFGKWGMGIVRPKQGFNFGVHPSVLGYDFSDGQTTNFDGGFKQNEWTYSTSDDPKKIFSLTEKSISFIEKQVQAKKPFYLQLSHYAVHTNITSRNKTLEKYKNLKKGELHKNPNFAALTEDLDTSFGIILKKVKELGIENNTYIIYTSDNGSVPTFPPRKNYSKSYNYPLSRGKWDCMEGGIRIPFIISGPNIRKNSFSDVPINLSDFLPTIADLSGNITNFPTDLDGGSFKNILFKKGKGIVKRSHPGFYFHLPFKNGIALNRPHSAIRIKNYKLLKFHDNQELRLYNIQKDISEQSNIASFCPERTKKMEGELEKYFKEVQTVKWKKGVNWMYRPISKIDSYYK